MVMYTRYSEKRLIGSIFVSIRKVIVTQKITRVLRTSIGMKLEYSYILNRDSSCEITFLSKKKEKIKSFGDFLITVHNSLIYYDSLVISTKFKPYLYFYFFERASSQ